MAQLRIAGLLLLLILPLTIAAQSLDEQLLAATRKSDAVKVKELLTQGANVNAKSPYGATPLFFACDRSNVEIVKILLEKGADVNVKDTFYGASPLGWSLGKGNAEIVRMLVEKGAKDSANALGFALEGGHLELAKAVLAKGGIDQKVLDKSLRAANGKGQKEIAEALVKAGAKEVPEFKVAPEKLLMYEGTFKSDALSIVCKVKDGKLIGTANGSDNLLTPVSEHTFEIEQANGVSMTFTLEGDKITGLTVQTPGNKFVLKKEMK
jgi:ankyrin repeat protein